MSGYSEFEFGINALQKMMKAYFDSKDEIKVIDSLDVIKNIKNKNKVFICAFTSLEDSLSQWRLYASNATGTAIGINTKKVDQYCIDNNLPFGSVVYSDNFEKVFHKFFKVMMPSIRTALEDRDENKAGETIKICILISGLSSMREDG